VARASQSLNPQPKLSTVLAMLSEGAHRGPMQDNLTAIRHLLATTVDCWQQLTVKLRAELPRCVS